MCAPSTSDHFQKSYSEISLACADSQAFCRADITLHQLSKYLAGKGDLGKYNALEKAIGYEILYMCVTPGKKNTTIYEMIPADMLDEALDEFKRLQGIYESPHHSQLMSRDGAKQLFYQQLRTGILDVNRHVASSQGGTRRPYPFPEHSDFEPHRLHLADNTLYLTQMFQPDSEPDSDSEHEDSSPEDSVESAEEMEKVAAIGSDEKVARKKKCASSLEGCDFPDCKFDDVPLRHCNTCGDKGRHHHLCAIKDGQEEMSTNCYNCSHAGVVRNIADELEQYPVLASPDPSRVSSPIGSQKGRVAEGSEGEEESRVQSSPNKYAMGGSIPPAAGTPQSRYLFGYGAGMVLKCAGEGECFFLSSRASVVAMCTYLTSPQKAFFASSVRGLKHHIKEFLLNQDSLLDHMFDMRVGCPPEPPDEDDIAKKASIRQVLLEDHGETPEEHAASILVKSYYGGVAEMMVVALATHLVVQSGTMSNVGGSTVFQPLMQITPPEVDLASYPEQMIIRLGFNGLNHFDGFQPKSLSSPKSTCSAKSKVSLSNRFDVLLCDENGAEDGAEEGPHLDDIPTPIYNEDSAAEEEVHRLSDCEKDPSDSRADDTRRRQMRQEHNSRLPPPAWQVPQSSLTASQQSELAAEEEEAEDKIAADKAAADKIAAAEKIASEEIAADEIASDADMIASKKIAAADEIASEKIAEKIAADEISGTVTSAVTSADKIASDKISADEIAAAAPDKIASTTIDSDKIAADEAAALRASELAAVARSQKTAAAEKIASEKIAADEIAATVASADKIASEKISADKIASTTIDSDEIAADEAAALRASRLAAVVKNIRRKTTAAEKIASEKIAADEIAATVASADKIASDKIAADKIASITASKRIDSDKIVASLRATKLAAVVKNVRAPSERAAKAEKLSITHALTLKQSEYTRDMLALVKPVENRDKTIGPGWLALHNGSGCNELPSHIVAVARFGAAPKLDAVHIVDVPEDVEAALREHMTGPLCNIVVEIQELVNPVPCSGAQGLWPMTEKTRQKVVDEIAELESTITGFEDLIECVPPDMRTHVHMFTHMACSRALYLHLPLTAL